jgi:hypothetical protein
MNNKRNNTSNSNLLIRKFIKSINNQLNSISKTNNNQEENETRRDKPNIKWTDKGMFWITVILTIATFLLFREATNQSGISQQAANASTIAANESINAFNLAKIAADSTDSFNVRNFKLQNKSINAQIQSLNDAKAELDKENRPFAQLADMRFADSVAPGNNIKLAYNVIDLGKFPAKILSIRASTATSQTDDNSLMIKLINSYPERVINHFAFNQFFIPETVTSISEYGPSECIEIKSGTRFIYFFGQIRYCGILSSDIFINTFIYKITVYPSFDVTALENKDSVIHKK